MASPAISFCPEYPFHEKLNETKLDQADSVLPFATAAQFFRNSVSTVEIWS